jgi:hypothetical protein
MAKVKLAFTKKLLDFHSSEQKYDECEMKIPQFSVMKNLNVDSHLHLIVGYTSDNKYVVVRESGLKLGTLDAYPITKEGLENNKYYERISRKEASNLGILSTKVNVGDKVICVAKERYGLIKFGQTYKVGEITPEGRLRFNNVSYSYSYDPKYFVIVEREGVSTFPSVTGTQTVSISSQPGTGKRGFGPENEDEHPLMRRKRVDKDIQKIRPIYDPEKISRIK